MEKRPQPIGEILSGMGRITPADVERALAHQRARGGYFGDALVELGLLSPDEVKFALADQYDLPFVQLRPESIDRSVAQMVPAEWAREHQILPVLRDNGTVTVILTSPPTAEQLEVVRRFTRAERVEAAVSSTETMRSLIDAVYGRMDGAQTGIGAWIAQAIAVGAKEVGVSVRGGRVSGWYRTEGTVRCALRGNWLLELREMISRFAEPQGDGVRSWPAILFVQEQLWRVECSAVEGAGATEWVARIGAAIPADVSSPAASPELRSACAALGARGSVALRACWEATGPAAGVLEVLLPSIPGALLDRSYRSLHLADRPVAVPPGVLSLRPDRPLPDILQSLEAFALDALTLDVERLEPEDLAAARRVAPLVGFRASPAQPNGLQADLDVCLRGDDTLIWTTIA